jgi:hypothetical protein
MHDDTIQWHPLRIARPKYPLFSSFSSFHLTSIRLGRNPPVSKLRNHAVGGWFWECFRRYLDAGSPVPKILWLLRMFLPKHLPCSICESPLQDVAAYIPRNLILMHPRVTAPTCILDTPHDQHLTGLSVLNARRNMWCKCRVDRQEALHSNQKQKGVTSIIYKRRFKGEKSETKKRN